MLVGVEGAILEEAVEGRRGLPDPEPGVSICTLGGPPFESGVTMTGTSIPLTLIECTDDPAPPGRAMNEPSRLLRAVAVPGTGR